MHPQMRQLLVHLGAGRLRDNREDAGLMLHAAPFHDIGKLGIARHNLLKPRRLDPDEWDVMQTHVEIGAGLIDGIDVPYQSMACSIALTHHERWDGSGYPKELKGENIHIEGRLTALCDVFDALTSDRPLHAPWSSGDAAAYICAHAGIHFDPKLARLFEDSLADLIGIHERFCEDPAQECRIVMEELAEV